MSGFLCSMVGVSAVAAVAEVIRKKKGIIANGNAQIDTAQSKFGGASALFDGTADYLLINPITDFSFEANNFTIEGWFRFNDSSTRIMFDTRPATTQGWYPTIYWISSTVRLYLNGGDRINSSGLSLSTWYHIALVRSGADYKLYINGTQSGSTYTDSTSLSAGQVVLGADAYSLGSSSFNGHIDEFRISNTARYTTTFTPSTTPFTNDDNTLLLLHMNGTDASTYFEDDNGVRYKNSVVAQGNAQLDTAQSKFGGSSLLLDGTGDFTRTPVIGSTFSFGTGDFTIEAWARANSLGGDNKLFGGDTNNDFFFGRYSGKWSVGKVGVSAVIDATSSVSTGTWYHMAISRSSGTTKIFQNGTQIASASDTYGWKFTNYFQLGAEGSGTSTTWNGWVDEVRVSNTARYTANFTAPTTPFVNDENTLLLLHMNGTDASTYFEDDNGVRDQKAIAAYGNAQIDTAQSKFGGTSLALDGTGDYLTVAKTDDMNVGSGNFTVEAWVRLTSNSADSFITCGNGSGGFFFGFRPGSTAVGYGRSAVAWDYSPTVTVTTGTWTHWAVCRSGTSIRLFKDGVQFGTTQTSSQSYNFAVTTLMAIGAEYNNGSPQLYLNGWIDELRISNSARYTANFTPSTTPFQNDDNTLLLLHMDGTDASTVFVDDNGVTPNWEY